MNSFLIQKWEAEVYSNFSDFKHIGNVLARSQRILCESNKRDGDISIPSSFGQLFHWQSNNQVRHFENVVLVSLYVQYKTSLHNEFTSWDSLLFQNCSKLQLIVAKPCCGNNTEKHWAFLWFWDNLSQIQIPVPTSTALFPLCFRDQKRKHHLWSTILDAFVKKFCHRS